MKKLILDLTESEKQRILKMHENALKNERGLFFEQEETSSDEGEIPPKSDKPIEVTVMAEAEGKYAAGKSDPAAFIGTILETLVAEIEKNTDAKTLLDEKKLAIKALYVQAGGTNNWGGKPTSYDAKRDQTTGNLINVKKIVQYSGDSDNKLYQLNKDLANTRAKTLLEKILPKLQAKGIQLSTGTKQVSSGWVINTGGKLDGQHNLKPGQFVKVILVVGNKLDIDTFRVNITKYDDIKANFVLKGYYNCNGFSSEGRNAQKSADVYLPMCDAVRKKYLSTTNAVMVTKTLGSFEIKWNPDVLNDPYTEPIRRWLFNWVRTPEGRVKIQDVTVVDVNKAPIQYIPPGAFAVGNITPSDPQLKFMMNLGKNKLWDTFVKPYLS